MADMPGEGLVQVSAAEAAIAPYRAGGLIEGALSVPESSMDRFAQEHLSAVALLNARNDTVPERPTYIFNPGSGLLINYAYRRSHNPAYEGFFADIVELDEEGRPRQGVSVVNPFAPGTGFIRVAVGENDYGFAPSSVNFRLDSENSDDPTRVVPPNIEMADLQTMLMAEPIPEGMGLDEFIKTRKAGQEAMRGRVQARHSANYLATEQAMADNTDANYHLIISDRDDTRHLEAASREVGLFPLVLSAMEAVRAALEMKRMQAPDYVFKRLSTYVPVDGSPNALRDLLMDTVPAFLTFDFEHLGGAMDERWESKKVNFPDEDSHPADVHFAAQHLLAAKPMMHGESPIGSNPFFSKLFNPRYYVETEFAEVRKTAHGVYEYGIGLDGENMRIYTDWLRKVRLDFALTLYLRGLSKL